LTARRTYDGVVIALVVVAFSAMLGAALIGTLARYLTFLPVITWGEEVTRFAGIWSVFLVSGLSVRQGAHFGVDLLTSKLPRETRRRLNIAIFVTMLAFLGVLLVYGVQIALDNLGQYSPALEWKMGLVYLCIPIGAVLMIVEALIIIANLLRGGDVPNAPPESSPG
jgi:TRAP-type transport system small permease protein